MKSCPLPTQRNTCPSEDAATSPVTMTLLHPCQWAGQLAAHRNRFARWMFYVRSSKKPPIKTERSSPIQLATRWSNWAIVDAGGHLSHCIKHYVLQQAGQHRQTIRFIFRLLKSRDSSYCINKFSNSNTHLFIQGCLPHRGKEKHEIFLTFGWGKPIKDKNYIIRLFIRSPFQLFSFLSSFATYFKLPPPQRSDRFPQAKIGIRRGDVYKPPWMDELPPNPRLHPRHRKGKPAPERPFHNRKCQRVPALAKTDLQ